MAEMGKDGVKHDGLALTIAAVSRNCPALIGAAATPLLFFGQHKRVWVMAKPTTVKIKLVSTADTGFFYVTKKNPRSPNTTEKMVMRKYDPVVRKHVEFKEAKIK